MLGRDLLRRARYRLSLDLDRTLGLWQFGGGLEFTGERRDFGQQLAAYSLLNLRASRRLGAGLRLAVALENILNKHWEPAAGYQGQPRGVFLRLHYRLPLAGR